MENGPDPGPFFLCISAGFGRLRVRRNVGRRFEHQTAIDVGGNNDRRCHQHDGSRNSAENESQNSEACPISHDTSLLSAR
jgi:hypothetical protein